MNDLNKKKVVLDTNIFMQQLEHIEDNFDKYQFVLTTITLEELDNMKFSQNQDKAYKARSAIRFIEQYEEEFEFVINDKLKSLTDWVVKNDNLILDVAKLLDCAIAAHDKAVKIKALKMGVEFVELDKKDMEKYTGWKIVEMDDYELANWYSDDEKFNKWGLLLGQYLLIKNNGQFVDTWKWSKDGFSVVSNKKISSVAMGNFKPKDIYQKCLVDSILSNKITLVKGKPGSGKSLTTLQCALNQIESGRFNKLICFVNPLPVANSSKLGFYPGTRDEKVLESSAGAILGSKMGMDTVHIMMNGNKLEIIPMCDIRGYDTSGSNSIVWVQEAQNNSIDLIKLALQRIGEDCKVILDGDFEAQVDSLAFANGNNGMRRVSEVFRGQDIYGEVELPIIYRSKIAGIADKL